jgi:hypothetical protein
VRAGELVYARAIPRAFFIVFSMRTESANTASRLIYRSNRICKEREKNAAHKKPFPAAYVNTREKVRILQRLMEAV